MMYNMAMISSFIGELMNDQIMLFLVLFALSGIGGWVIIRIGLSDVRNARKLEEQERARTYGTVVDIVKYTPLGRGKIPYWRPVVEYTVDGKILKQESRLKYWMDDFKVGEKVDILYDADDPGCFHLEKWLDRQIRHGRIIMIIGAIWLVGSAVVAFIYSRPGGV